MNEKLLVGLLLSVMLLAGMIALYPLQKKRSFTASLFILVLSLFSLGYWQWGGFKAWQENIHQQDSQKQLAILMKQAKGPDAIIKQLNLRLKENPNSAKGWYLLARVYSSQGDWTKALAAFTKAHQLEPENEAYSVYYAQGLWQVNHQEFSETIRSLFITILNKNPNQPDALAMLAMDAFMSHAYEDAIQYWQRLLTMAPGESEEALALRKAIAQAQQKLDQGRHHD